MVASSAVVAAAAAAGLGALLVWRVRAMKAPRWARHLYPVNYDADEKNEKKINWMVDRQRDEETNEDIRPFVIEVSDEVLDDLQRRLAQTRFHTELDGVGWAYGMRMAYVRRLIDYWRTEYDWRRWQARLTRDMPQFVTTIEGLDIHFVHCKVPNNPNKVPIVFVHGWPGSFLEFYKVIDTFTKGTPAFDVIIPSIPGYAFSQAAQKPGMSIGEIAVLFSKLISRLGYKEYIAQGGDWGSPITGAMAQLDPMCIGLHVNFTVGVGNPLLAPFRLGLGSLFPSWVLPDYKFRDRVLPAGNLLMTLVQATGYFHEQATKPDTIGFAINNSPASLAAWIVEKFYEWSDSSGMEEPARLTMDEMITNVMIYWVTGCAPTAGRLYKEMFNSKSGLASASSRVDVPSAIADFKNEMMHLPPEWATFKYTNLIQYNSFDEGGHFAALEVPETFSRDVLSFAKKALEIHARPSGPSGPSKSKL